MSRQRKPGELKRDEEREEGGPRYGGEGWEVAAQREPEERFGKARNDDADPLELIKAGQGDNNDDESPTAADPELAEEEAQGRIESGGEHEGFGRGEKPRKPKARTKPNPKPHTKTKQKSSTSSGAKRRR
jgi:hypothetical protein